VELNYLIVGGMTKQVRIGHQIPLEFPLCLHSSVALFPAFLDLEVYPLRIYDLTAESSASVIHLIWTCLSVPYFGYKRGFDFSFTEIIV